MADLPFVDAHVHLWDRQEPALGGYGWLDPAAGPDPTLGDYRAIMMPRYWADDLLAETRFANVVATIHVQAASAIADPAAETRWLQAAAERTGHPHGIVAGADLAAPDVGALLDRHAACANLRGIRDLRYDGYLDDPAWDRGVGLVAARGLVLCDDPLVEAMPAAARLAARHPDLTLCIDHAGFPRARDAAAFRAWRAGMRLLAARPNTVVKISGLGMADHRWTVESIRPWVEECIALWGPGRALFGTNWPVDRLFSSYSDVVDAYAALTADLTPGERAALFHGTAQRVFRI